MAKQNNNPVQCENTDIEILRRQMIRNDESINKRFDKLQEIILENKSQPTLPAPVEVRREPIEVRLPTDYARKGDVIPLTQAIQNLTRTDNSMVSSMDDMKKAFDAMPKATPLQEAKSIIDSAKTGFADEIMVKFKPAIEDGFIRAFSHQKSPGIGVDDVHSVNARLDRINENVAVRNEVDSLRKKCKFFAFAALALFDIAVIAIYFAADYRQERNKLQNVEWLYRRERTLYRTDEDKQLLVNHEREFFTGTKNEQDSIRDDIRARERRNGTDKTFTYYAPTAE